MIARDFWFRNIKLSLREKCPNTELFSGPYFPACGLNTEIFGVNLRIQFKHRKIRTRKNSVFGHFPRSVSFRCHELMNEGRSVSYQVTKGRVKDVC